MFKLHSKYQPSGDQPKAIQNVVANLQTGLKHQTLLGVTGSGKTYTMANVVERVQKPTLVMCHNKTLAAQLASEFQTFFPDNAVHYFVSYYDYYQPEAYIPRSDTFIEKETQINEEIDRLRNAATASLLSRRDTLIVASVSCIYGLGNPSNYLELSLKIERGTTFKRDKLLRRLTDLQYARNQYELKRSTFRLTGDILDIVLAGEDTILRLDFFGDEVEKITRHNAVTGEHLETLESCVIYPAKHFVTPEEQTKRAIGNIKRELSERLSYFKTEGKILEMQRLEQRTNFDLETLETTGFVAGIENYSRHLDGRLPGEAPSTLIDYFPDDFLLFVDESHQTIPQVGAMYEGDKSRKTTLVDYGFRLPSALDNRPLRFPEFEHKVNQVVYVSATPGPYELRKSLIENTVLAASIKPAKSKISSATNAKQAGPKASLNSSTEKPGSKVLNAKTGQNFNQAISEMIVRPTGLLDPEVEILPIDGQIDKLLERVIERRNAGERTIITTLSKRMAEELAGYLKEEGIKAGYIHSELDTFERLDVLRNLRLGVFDCIVGINLLREGLDLPEVSLVAILDADKEGFLRSHTSFMQIMGRAARHVHGHVLMFADRITKSMESAISETKRRREIQEVYNKTHGITPMTIIKSIQMMERQGEAVETASKNKKLDVNKLSKDELKYYINELEDQMELAAKNLEFELAASLRDEITTIKKVRKLKK